MTTLSKDTPLADIKALFANDRFATGAAGCEIVEGGYGHAVCKMPIVEVHLNAQGSVMGGAIFTLADFALAIACNIGEEPTVAVSNTIDYIAAPKGSVLIATADVDKSGRNLGFYTVHVTDDTGRLVAKMSAKCFRRAS
jgi:acyl-CoA thioesterase